MLHLQACVHLHEEEFHTSVRLLDDELHCACAHIIHGLSRRHGCCAHRFAHGLRQPWRWRFFQHLLMPSLHRAIAFKQIHAMALRIPKHLNLDVARTLHVLLNQHRIVAKTIDGFAFARGEGNCKTLATCHNPHPLATTACASFNQHRVANPIRFALQQRRILIGTVIAWNQRYTRRAHQSFGLGL